MKKLKPLGNSSIHEAPVLWHRGKKNEMKDYEYHWFTLHGSMKNAIRDMIKAIQDKDYDRYDVLYKET